MAQNANNVFRDFTTDGVPSSGLHNPKKADIREWGTYLEQLYAAAQAGGGVVFQTKATMTLGYAANQIAWVISDTTAANNGIYQKQGASGAGSWARVGDLPYSVIQASNTGAGTENALAVRTSIPIPQADGAALVIVNITAENTGPATISFNGGVPLIIKTNSGNDVAPGGLVAGMQIVGTVSGATFRLLSDQASGAVMARTEAAAVRAEAAALSVESPVSYAPQALTQPQQAQARENIATVSYAPQSLTSSQQAQALENIAAVSYHAQPLTQAQQAQVRANIGVTARTRAHITFHKTSSMTYEKIEISGGVDTLSKHLGSGGITGSMTMREFAQEAGRQVALNCDASESYSASLQIIGGVAYSNFSAGSHTQEAIILKKDGRLYPAYMTDGKTAQDYVNEGAIFSAGHRKLLVVGGARTDLSGHVDYTAQLSARTILGQRPNGDFVMLFIEGKTSDYGVTYVQAQSLCLAEGLEIAMNLDGGGSTQSWWGGSYYVHHSSDPQERPTRGYLTVNVSDMNTFDTGNIEVPVAAGVTRLDGSIPALVVRQCGAHVFVNYAASATLTANTNFVLTNQFPIRFSPQTAGWMRTHLQAANGISVALINGGASPEQLTLRATAAATYAIGGTVHPSKWSGLPYK